MFNIHNDRELTLLKYLNEECNLYIKSEYSYLIGKINGLLCSWYMREMIKNPLTGGNQIDIIKLKESIQEYILKR